MLDAAQRAGERGEAGAASPIDGAADPAAAAAAETAAASATAASDAASRAASAGAFARMVQARLATMPQAQRSALLGLLEQERASARAGAAAAASAAVLVQPGQEAGQGGQAEQLLAALRQISPAGYSSVAGMLLTPAADAGVTAGAAGADADLAEVAAALRTRAAGGAGTSQQCTTGGTAIEGTVCESPHGAGSGSVAACVNSSAPDSEEYSALIPLLQRQVLCVDTTASTQVLCVIHCFNAKYSALIPLLQRQVLCVDTTASTPSTLR